MTKLLLRMFVRAKGEKYMNKQERYDLYAGAVYPGWWWLLDEYTARCRAIDPVCTFEIKEKYGTLRIFTLSDGTRDWKTFGQIESEAERASLSVCELCGAHGKIRTERRYIQTLCDRCAAVDHDLEQKRRIVEETKQRWLSDKE